VKDAISNQSSTKDYYAESVNQSTEEFGSITYLTDSSQKASGLNDRFDRLGLSPEEKINATLGGMRSATNMNNLNYGNFSDHEDNAKLQADSARGERFKADVSTAGNGLASGVSLLLGGDAYNNATKSKHIADGYRASGQDSMEKAHSYHQQAISYAKTNLGNKLSVLSKMESGTPEDIQNAKTYQSLVKQQVYHLSEQAKYHEQQAKYSFQQAHLHEKDASAFGQDVAPNLKDAGFFGQKSLNSYENGLLARQKVVDTQTTENLFDTARGAMNHAESEFGSFPGYSKNSRSAFDNNDYFYAASSNSGCNIS